MHKNVWPLTKCIHQLTFLLYSIYLLGMFYISHQTFRSKSFLKKAFQRLTAVRSSAHKCMFLHLEIQAQTFLEGFTYMYIKKKLLNLK